MPFSIRLFGRFPVHCSVSYNAGPFQRQGTVGNFSCTGWRLSGDLPMRPGETFSLTATLPNEQWIEVPGAVVERAGVFDGKSRDRGAYPRTAPALYEATGAGTSGECPVSNNLPMPRRFSIALVLSLVCLAVPAWADFQAGIDANNRGDYATALHEWRPLAERGDARAQFQLGLLYDNGDGVPRDYAKARQWYEKAAAQGEVKAQFYLGLQSAYGEGGPLDLVQAHMWYSLAAGNGYAHAPGYRDDLARQMTPSQIAEAHKRAREWKEKTP